MSITVAQWLVMLLQLYLAIGFVFAVAFVWRGVGQVDPVAAEGTRGFKILIFPGCVALWPLLLRRWVAGTGTPPTENNAHRRAAARGGST
ncbi:MAG: hypothetical protein AAFX50_04605 [Acidobacteriota bacterium]